MPSLAGPHSGMIATYGTRRKDSLFTLNNSVKGVGFLPKAEKLPRVIAEMERTMENPMPDKLQFLEDLYKDRGNFDTRLQVSLELYATPDFETHTFLNLMENPVATIVYLDYPSYEIRCIGRLLHPKDPNLSQWERNVVKYVNLVHSYFHGKFPRLFVTSVFFVIEAFDNTPGKKEGCGRKSAPKVG